jgi:RNA polymerase sigma-70 factor, ECF subfamily
MGPRRSRSIPSRRLTRHGVMNKQERHSLFSDLLSRHQSQLYAYIFAVVRNREDTADLFQSVCMILWRKFDQFQPGSSFFCWARVTAHHVISDFLRRKKLPMQASADLLDALAETPLTPRSDAQAIYLDALQRCRTKLSAGDEELLGLRYAQDLRNQQIAARLQRSQQSVCNSLTRIRRLLLDCVLAELARHDRPSEDRS